MAKMLICGPFFFHFSFHFFFLMGWLLPYLFVLFFLVYGGHGFVKKRAKVVNTLCNLHLVWRSNAVHDAP